MLRRKTRAAALLGLFALSATPAFAGHNGTSEYVRAKVVDVEPIVRRVSVDRPRRECWDEVVHVRDGGGRPFGVAGQAFAGGVIGAAIGRQFGGGSGRDALTALGAMAGSAVAAERAARRRSGEPAATRRTVVERCETVTERVVEERIDGYRVTYKYRGRHHTVVMNEPPPGKHVRLRISAVPVGY